MNKNNIEYNINSDSKQQKISADNLTGSWLYNFKEKTLNLSKEIFIIQGLPEVGLQEIENSFDYFDSKTKEIFFQAIENAANNNQNIDLELNIVTSKGKQKLIRISGELKKNKNSEPEHIFGTIQDISNIILHKQKTEAFETKYKTLYESLYAAFIIIKDNKCTDCNSNAVSMFDLTSKTELLGSDPFSFTPAYQPDGQDSKILIQTSIEKAFKNKFHQFEWQAKRKNGELFFSEIKITPFISENELHFQLLILDIEKNKNEENFRKILDAFDDPIYISNRENKILYANKAMRDIIGTDKIGKKCHKIIYDSDLPCAWCIYDELMKSKELIAYDMKVPGKEEYKYVRNIIIENDHKLTIYHDITERKKIIKELNELNAAKDKFISILAHDLKNPFNALVGFSDILLKNIHKYDLNKIEEFVKKINLISKKTYELLEDILLWARAQSKQLVFLPKKYSFFEICSDVVSELKYIAESKGINLVLDKNEDYKIFTDLNMFKTIIRNLITNAIKFTNKNGNINVFLTPVGELAEITVSDNGIGIKPKDIEKIWNLNENFSTTGTENESGTGFGLHICKEFAQINGGNIRVESTEGKGSNFIFSVPIAK